MGISSHIQSMPLNIIFLPHISQVINSRCWKSWESQTGWSICSWLRDSVLWMHSLLRSRYGWYCLVTFPHVVPSTIKILPGKILQMKWIDWSSSNPEIPWLSRCPWQHQGVQGRARAVVKIRPFAKDRDIWTLFMDFKPSTDNMCIVSTSHY